MKIRIVTPAPRGSRRGNRVTALRWALFLRRAGHDVRAEDVDSGAGCDVLFGLHAEKSAPAVRAAGEARRIVVLTGTDIWPEIGAEALGAMHTAERIVALHGRVAARLPGELRARVRVIRPSAAPLPRGPLREDVCVLAAVGHLRAVKDPLFAARAVRGLPAECRVRIEQLGGSLDAGLAAMARAESAANPRWTWLGERRHRETRAAIAAAHALLLTSQDEGGPTVVAEALMSGTPVLAPAIDAVLDFLGEDYPGTYPPGDEAALAALLQRFVMDTSFRATLSAHCAARRHAFTSEAECASLTALVAELR